MTTDLNKQDLTPDVIKGVMADIKKTFNDKSAEQSADFKKLEATMAGIEGKNADLVKTIEAEKTANAELKELVEKQMKSMERVASRPNADENEKVQAKSDMKLFEKFVTKGMESFRGATDELEKKFMNTYTDEDGGVLAPNEYVREILKDVTEISNLRAVARTRTAGAGRMEIPVRSSLVTVNWEGEYEEAQDSNSQYQLRKVPLNKIMVNVPITIEELQDAAFDMESEINMDIAEAFAQKEGAAFINGDGVKKPEGILSSSDISEINTEDADGITMDSIIKIAGEVKAGYNPLYLMNRKTIAYVQQLKESTSGRYLWQAGNIAAGVPNQLNGYSYLEMPDMEDVAVNANPIAFGDFRQGYLIGDGAELTVIRDPYTLKKRGMVEFTFMRRVGGGVVKPEAIKLLKCATT